MSDRPYRELKSKNRELKSKKKGSLYGFFTQSFALLFLSAGVICAIISGLIEYQVFNGLFPKSIGFQSFFLIPFLIVFAFETTKLFLVFYFEKFGKDENNRLKHPFLGYLRKMLIIISGLCTMIFCLFNLYNPDYDNQLKAAKDKHESDYQTRLDEINKRHEKSRLESRTSQQVEIDKWLKRMKEEERVKNSSGDFRGKNWIAHKEEYENAKKFSADEIKRIQVDQQKELAALFEDKKNGWDQIEKSLKIDIASDNKMLSSALQIMFQAIKGFPNYPKWTYLFCIVFLSVFITICLETTISASFTIYAINPAEIFEFSQGRIMSRSIFTAVSRVVPALATGIITSFSFWMILLAISSFLNDSEKNFYLSYITPPVFFGIVLAGCISKIVCDYISKIQDHVVWSKTLLKDWSEKGLATARDILVIAALNGFCGLLIGFLIKGDLTAGSPFAIGVAIAGVIAHVMIGSSTRKIS